MPTYGYRCEKNGHEFEVVQSMTDPPRKRCIICGSKVRRIFYPVGITFKGSGFYKTDSRSSSSASVGGGESKSEDKAAKSEDKPAKSEPASDSKSSSSGSKKEPAK